MKTTSKTITVGIPHFLPQKSLITFFKGLPQVEELLRALFGELAPTLWPGGLRVGVVGAPRLGRSSVAMTMHDLSKQETRCSEINQSTRTMYAYEQIEH